MTAACDVAFKIVLRSPFIMAGMDPSGVGIDTPALRDETGKSVLPGDHLKGLLREALTRLETADSPLFKVNGGQDLSVQRLFGTEASQRLEPGRGRLRLRDLTAANLPADAGDITRIEIDDTSGAVKTGALQVVELVAPLHTTVEFTGTSLFYGTADEAKALEKVLKAGLKMIPAFGGVKTAGFGEHESSLSTVKVTSLPQIASGTTRWPAGEDRVAMTGHFDRAFMVDVERASDNVYVGGTIVPGAAIKGALADLLTHTGHVPSDMSQPLGKALAALSISHAHPVIEGVERDLPIPLSMMKSALKDDDFACAFSSATPGLMDGLCADFQPDWKPKHFSNFRTSAGRPGASIPQLMRGHTAINSKGIAEDEKLFLEVMRATRDGDGKAVSHRFVVDLAAAVQEDAASAHLIARVLASGLDCVGKTHAAFVVDDCQPARADPVAPTGRWRVLLETPALLLDGEGLGTSTGIADDLIAYFKHLLPDATLADHYVRRTLKGGYAVRRSRPSGGYRPVSLYNPGSCFLLTTTSTDHAVTVAKSLETLQRKGLPVLRRTNGGLSEVSDWSQTIYLPGNGYGRISIEADVFTHFDQPSRAAP